MTLDIERSYTAPFSTYGEGNIRKIFIWAGLITLGGSIISVGFSSIVNKFTSMISLVKDPTVVAILFILILPLIIISIAINFVANAIPFGYVLETIRLEINNEKSIMPQWEGNYKRFFFDGLKIQAILLVYSLVIVLLPITVFSPILIITNINMLNTNVIANNMPVLTIVLLIILLSIVYLLILPLIWVHFANTGKVLSSFNILIPVKIILSNPGDYFIATFVTIVLSIVFSVIIIFLACTCVGILLVPLAILFILPIIVLNMYSQIYKIRNV